MTLADSIVQTARGYLGTRWVHQGRLKGIGVDCIGLVICVAHDLGLSTYDTTDYARTPDGVFLQKELMDNMEKVVGDPKPGDILLMRFDKEPQHVCIVTDLGGRLGIIHGYAQARKVVEHGLDELWLSRVVAAYRFKEIA